MPPNIGCGYVPTPSVALSGGDWVANPGIQRFQAAGPIPLKVCTAPRG
jgi:hypothetical protein